MEEIIKEIENKFSNSQSYLFKSGLDLDFMNAIITKIKRKHSIEVLIIGKVPMIWKK